MKIFYFTAALLLISFNSFTQDCNKLGAWLWYIEITGFNTHAALADTLSTLGVKRIYVKVADGKVNTALWPELTDKELVKAYKNKGLEVWAWSYNYPENESEQANALYLAASTGYQGYVIDVETEFDNKPQAAHALFSAFRTQKNAALSENLITTEFGLYCTTWGNPEDHFFPVADIDPFVDAFMPQTYVENWGNSYISNLAYWIEAGNDEFRRAGATKALHHIVSTEKDIISSEKINEFFEVSGPESSIWVIPGDNTRLSIWNTWRQVRWDMNFCVSSVSPGEPPGNSGVQIYPNPSFGIFTINKRDDTESLSLMDYSGKIIWSKNNPSKQTELELDMNSPGLYILKCSLKNGKIIYKKLLKY
jgi:hypothetical protein